MRYTLVLVLVLALVVGCESPKNEAASSKADEVLKPAATADTVKPSEAQATGPIKVGAIKIQASAHALRYEGAPSAKELEQVIRAELNSLPSFSDDGTRTATGQVTFDIRDDEVNGARRIEVIIFGALDESSRMNRKFSAEVIATNADQPTLVLTELVALAAQRFAKRLDGNARAVSASDEELVALLGDEGEDASVRLIAVQEVRDRRLSEATEPARKLLENPDERLNVAAAAALVALKDEASYSAIIGLAENMSRDRNRQLMPLLYLIGDMGTDESTTYLKAVAEAHSDASVRRIAGEALNRGAAR